MMFIMYIVVRTLETCLVNSVVFRFLYTTPGSLHFMWKLLHVVYLYLRCCEGLSIQGLSVPMMALHDDMRINIKLFLNKFCIKLDAKNFICFSFNRV